MRFNFSGLPIDIGNQHEESNGQYLSICPRDSVQNKLELLDILALDCSDPSYGLLEDDKLKCVYKTTLQVEIQH